VSGSARFKKFEVQWSDNRKRRWLHFSLECRALLVLKNLKSSEATIGKGADFTQLTISDLSPFAIRDAQSTTR
jgi:hypothetical protein